LRDMHTKINLDSILRELMDEYDRTLKQLLSLDSSIDNLPKRLKLAFKLRKILQLIYLIKFGVLV